MFFSYIIDKNIQFSNNLTIYEWVPDKGEDVNVNFTTNVNYNVVINAINGVVQDGGVGYGQDEIDIPLRLLIGSLHYYNDDEVNYNKIKNYKLRTCIGNFFYVTSSNALQSLYLDSMTSQVVADSIKSIIAYPFEIEHGNETCKFKDYQGNEHGINMYATGKSRYKFLIAEDFQLIPYNLTNYPWNGFAKNNSFLKIEVYIPYYGWINLDASRLGDSFYLWYNVDFSSGSAQVILWNYSHNRIEFEATCQLGIKLSISRSNLDEITARGQANNLNMAVGAVAAGAQIAIGVTTDNPYAIGRGITGAANTISNYISNNATLIPQANGSVDDSNTSFFGPQRLRVRYSYYKPITEVNDNYIKNLGFPTNKYCNFRKPSGFDYEHYYEIIDFCPDNTMLQSTITKSELEEIKKSLAEGVYW